MYLEMIDLTSARAKMARAGHRVYKYAWDLDEPIVIDENAILQVVDRQYIIQNRDMGHHDIGLNEGVLMGKK
jgi:hypothetical protein